MFMATWKGNNPQLEDLPTIVINHLLARMILQVGFWGEKILQISLRVIEYQNILRYPPENERIS